MNELQFILRHLVGESGCAFALGNLGWAYSKGAGIPQNLDKAAEYYERAIKMGEHQFKKLLDDIYDDTNEFKK